MGKKTEYPRVEITSNLAHDAYLIGVARDRIARRKNAKGYDDSLPRDTVIRRNIQGACGELCFERWLRRKKEKYGRSPYVVNDYGRIKQDFIIRCTDVDVKTTDAPLEKMCEYKAWLYPEKKARSSLIPKYPTIIVTMCLDWDDKACYLMGWVLGEVVMLCPTAHKKRNNFHFIQRYLYKPMAEMIPSLPHLSDD